MSHDHWHGGDASLALCLAAQLVKPNRGDVLSHWIIATGVVKT